MARKRVIAWESEDERARAFENAEVECDYCPESAIGTLGEDLEAPHVCEKHAEAGAVS